MNRRQILAGALALAAFVPNAVQAQLRWTGYSYVPSATLTSYKGMEDFAKAVEAATGGSISIRMNVAGGLPIRAGNITQSVGDGIIQIAADGFFLGNVEEGGVLRLPMLLNTPEEFDRALAVMEPVLNKAFERQGVVLLAHYRYPVQMAFSSKKLSALEDMRGQKMRTTSPEQGEFVRQFGGAPLTIAGGEVPSSLQSGAVDGVFTAASAGGRLWRDQLKHGYVFGPNYFNSVIVVNKVAFDALKADQRDALRKLAVDAGAKITREMAAEEVTVFADLRRGGMTITEANPADMQRATRDMARYWDVWAQGKSQSTREALAAVRAVIQR